VVYSGHVKEKDQIMLITDKGMLIKMKVKDISVQGRNTQGIRLIQLGDDEKVVDAAKIVEE